MVVRETIYSDYASYTGARKTFLAFLGSRHDSGHRKLWARALRRAGEADADSRRGGIRQYDSAFGRVVADRCDGSALVRKEFLVLEMPVFGVVVGADGGSLEGTEPLASPANIWDAMDDKAYGASR